MEGRTRALGAMALLAMLAGCSTGNGDVVSDKPAPGYIQDAAARVAAANWSKARDITIVMSEYKFSPADPIFQADRPYRLILRNNGERSHTFVSEGFFKAIAAQKLVSSAGSVATPAIETIEVAPGEEKQLYFIPVTRGTYPVECSVFLHNTFGMEGEITIL